jgi:hypothetical protein
MTILEMPVKVMKSFFGLVCGLADDPGGHAALVLDNCSFYGVDELTAELRGEVHEEGFVDAVALDSVGGEVAAAAEVLVGHADGGGQAAEEETVGLEDAPEIFEHRVEVRVVAGEVEDGAADDQVEGVVGVGDGFDGFDAEVFRGEMRGERGDESAGLRDGGGTLIGSEDLVAFAEEVDEIAAGSASGVEDSHAGHDVAAKDLVEEVDVDRAELLLEGGHRFKRMIQDGRQDKSGRGVQMSLLRNRRRLRTSQR